MISNCASDRIRYIENVLPPELVDICGSCDKYLRDYRKLNVSECGKNRFAGEGGGILGVKSLNLVNQYRFYLTLENSLCPGYVTEKIVKPVAVNSVPILFNVQNYEQLKLPNYLDLKQIASEGEVGSKAGKMKEAVRRALKDYSCQPLHHLSTGPDFFQKRAFPTSEQEMCKMGAWMKFNNQNNEPTNLDFHQCQTLFLNSFGCERYPVFSHFQ